ncbi:MAG: DUF4890 domain-containing protein [Flavobacteriales bacterium]|nr:DUF4890 domain-containing protein [Flavobacteriales bacterium]
MRIVNVFAAALLIGMGTGTLAQDSAPAMQKHRGQKQASPEERAQRMTERMTTELQLDDAQRTQVLAINQQHVQALEMLRAQRSDDKRDRAQVVVQQHEDALKGVLTPEQFERFKQLKAERAEKHRSMKQHRARSAEPGPEPKR